MAMAAVGDPPGDPSPIDNPPPPPLFVEMVKPAPSPGPPREPLSLCCWLSLTVV